MYSAKGLFSFSSWPFTTWSSLDLGLDAVVLARSEPFIITDSGKKNIGVRELPGTPMPPQHTPATQLPDGCLPLAKLMGDSSGFQHKNLLLPGCFFMARCYSQLLFLKVLEAALHLPCSGSIYFLWFWPIRNSLNILDLDLEQGLT